MRELSVQAMLLAAVIVGAFGVAIVRAQEPGEQIGMAAGRGQFAGMQRIQGEVTAVSGDTISIKTEDGSAMKVATTANTRVMMGRGEPLKVADVKVGDGVMAMGNLDAPSKTIHAALVFTTSAEEVKKLKENLGKTYIAGKVTAIDADNAKLTVLRADGVSQTIGLDEGTSFKRGGRAYAHGWRRWRAGWKPSSGHRSSRRRRKHHAGRREGRRHRRRTRQLEERRVRSGPIECVHSTSAWRGSPRWHTGRRCTRKRSEAVTTSAPATP